MSHRTSSLSSSRSLRRNAPGHGARGRCSLFLGLAVLSLALGTAGCWEPPGDGLRPDDAFGEAAHERYFPIEAGKHAELTCADCHASPQTFTEFTCVSCHDHSQELMDPTHAGFADYVFNSVSCYTCHPRGNVSEEVVHDFFPIRDDAAHGGLSCASCHTDANNREAVTCTTCHEHAVAPMARLHDAMPGYEWSSPTCLTCHPSSQATGLLDHSRLFPIAAPASHAEVTCAECHIQEGDRKELGCIECHDHAEADMAVVHTGVPSYLYESASCFLCHPNSEHQGEMQHERYFPIEVGDAHELGRVIPETDNELMECASCHVADDVDRSVVGCTTCHTHRRDVTDLTHAGVPEYAFASASCLFCHPGAEPTGFIEHEVFFPIALDTPHGGLFCSDCHKNPTKREEVTCISCHDHDQAPMAAVHDAIPGYAYDSPSCLACHPDGHRDGAIDHAFFPVGTGTQHEAATCNDCHIQPDDRSVVGCTGCHEHSLEVMAPVHDAMPGYQWDSATCLSCHPSGQHTGLLDHTGFFPIAVGTTHSIAGGSEITCASCHANPADRQALGCIACHQGDHDEAPMADAHDGVPDYGWESSSCFLCHQTAQVPGTMDHDSYFPIAAPAAHEGISCAECHTNPSTRSEVACITCHDNSAQAPSGPTNAIHDGVPGYTHASPSCLLCHPGAEPNGQIDHESLFPLAAPAAHNEVTCIECHTDPNNRGVLGCATCHLATEVNPVHGDIPGYAHTSTACISCHDRAQNPGNMDHSPYFPISGAVPHNTVTCVECHQTQTDRTQLLCATCHEQAPTAQQHAVIPGYQHDSTACLACHPQGLADGAFDHTPYFPIGAGTDHDVGCTECHINPSDNSELGCAVCHQQAETAQQHNAVPGYVHASPSCLTCHPYGEANGLAGVDHTAFFPIDTGTAHFGVGCGECHLDGQNLALNGCQECHATQINLDTTHAVAIRDNQRPGLIDDSQDCKKCHADSQVHPVQTHAPFRIANGPHKGRCIECHTDTRSDKPWALDFGPFDCLGCHTQNSTNNDHNGENGYQWSNPACINCHPRGD